MPVLLRCFSACNLIMALIVLLVQSMILTSYKQLSGVYSYVSGAGIWVAILLASNGIGLLLNLKRKFLCSPSKMFTVSLVICIVTFLAGLVLIGVTVATLYGPLPPQLHTEIASTLSTSTLARFEEDVTSWKALETILLGCGIISTIVNPFSVILLHLNYKMYQHEYRMHTDDYNFIHLSF